MSILNLNNRRRFANNKKIAGGWLFFSVFMCFLLFFLHVELFAIIGFGIISILPFGFLFFNNKDSSNSLYVKNEASINATPPQKIFQNNEKLEIEKNVIVKKTTIQKDGFDKKEEINSYFKSKINNDEIQNIKDLHTDKLNEALKNGVVVKSEELEKIAKKNDTKLDLMIGLNSWLLSRFSLDMDFVLLVDGEKIAISDTKEVIIDIDEMTISDKISKEEFEINSELLESIQNELNISESELENIVNEIKVSNTKSSTESEKSLTKEDANSRHNSSLKF